MAGAVARLVKAQEHQKMVQVRVRKGADGKQMIEQALRKLKRKMESEDVFDEVKDREYFVSKSERRHREDQRKGK